MAIPCSGSAAAAASAAKNCKQPLHALAPPRGCRVAGCRLELAPGYSAKYRICPVHYKMSSLEVDGKEQRFCQQCGRFHEVQAFEGERRSCKESLARHKQRRKKAEALRAAQQEEEQKGGHVEESQQEEGQQEQGQKQENSNGDKQVGGGHVGQVEHKAGSLASAAPPSLQATAVSATACTPRKQPRPAGSARKRGAQQARGPAEKKARAGSPKAQPEAAPARPSVATSGGSSRAASEAPSVHPLGPAPSLPTKPPTPAHSSPCAARSPAPPQPGDRGSRLRGGAGLPVGSALALPAPQLALQGPQLAPAEPVLAVPRPQPHLVQQALKTIGGSTLPSLDDDVPSTEELLTFSQELGLLLDPPTQPAPAHAPGLAGTAPAGWHVSTSGPAGAAWLAPARTATPSGWGVPSAAPGAGLVAGHCAGTPLPALQLPAWQSPALAASLAPLQRWSAAGHSSRRSSTRPACRPADTNARQQAQQATGHSGLGSKKFPAAGRSSLHGAAASCSND
ncbi:hypothetical protein ABPG75_008877 [Micractinium tetrahymenae]